jgi:hypothetical protein
MSTTPKLLNTLLVGMLILPVLARGGESRSADETAPALARGDEHVISAGELQRRAATASAGRRENLRKLERFFASRQVRESPLGARIDPARMQKAARLLSDDELARLAARAEQAQKDFSAGALSNEHLTYIVIALAAAVIVVLAT